MKKPLVCADELLYFSLVLFAFFSKFICPSYFTMPVLSPFQTLPLHIAENISRFHICDIRHPFSCYSKRKDEREAAAWEVLYDVSHQWRSLALDYLCGSLYRSLVGVRFMHMLGEINFTKSNYHPGDKNLHHVRKVRIHLSGSLNFLNALQVHEFDRIWPEDFVLPSATFVAINLQATIPNNAGYRTAFSSAFSQVVDRIKVTMPKLRRVKVCFGNDTFFMEMSAQSFVSKASSMDTLLLECLIRRGWWGRQMTTDCISTDISPSQDTPELTTLRCDCSDDICSYHYIVKSCASTLEELYIDKLQCHLAWPFFIHEDGRPVIFPRLKRLDIEAFESEEYKRIRTDKSVIPFPALRYIVLNLGYIFADDTIFRGNRDTLNYLFIDIDYESLEILQQCQMFSDGKYPHLRYVRVARNHIPRRKLSEEAFLKFPLGILSSETYWISIPSEVPKNSLVSIIPTSPYAENIQNLSLRKTKLNLLEMFSVIKLLPNMREFRCRFGEIGLEPDKGQTKTLPDYLYPTHYPLSRNLKCWGAWCSDDMLQDKMAAASITLAVLCPKFSFTAVLERGLSKYHDELRNALSSGLYDKHAEKILRLFYYG